jgi:soluble lytic murein transglycosylase-like protein
MGIGYEDLTNKDRHSTIAGNQKKEVDMESLSPPIETEHPPHFLMDMINGLSLRRLLLKITLFTIIFLAAFHLPQQITILHERERAIQEIASILQSRQTDLASVTKEDLAEAIYDEAVRYNYDPKFIMALIYAESNFYNWAVSKKGAKGMMQIMPDLARDLAGQLGIEWMGDRTLFNPYYNIRMGIYYLSQLARDFNDMEAAVTAYNYGPNYVKNLLDRKEKLPLEYYKSILSNYKNL